MAEARAVSGALTGVAVREDAAAFFRLNSSSCFFCAKEGDWEGNIG